MTRLRGPSRGRTSRALLGATLILLAAVPPATAVDGRPVASSPRGLSIDQQQRAIAFWTPARMAAARPFPLRGVAGRPSIDAVRDTRMRPRTAEAIGPAGDDGVVVQGAPQPAAYSYPFPFTRYAVESQLDSVFPYRAMGKIFFRQDGISFVCSGASVVGSPRNIVYTAGHCLHDAEASDPDFSTNVVFVPAYRSGVRPHGTFAATKLWVWSLWSSNRDFTYDFGAFSVGVSNTNLQTLRTRVGAMGFAWNQSLTQHWDVFGYPQAAPFDGATLQKCESSVAGTDENPILGTGPDPIAIGCDQTGGSSGGPWVLLLRRGNYINSVNSYKYTIPPSSVNLPLAMFGPYLGDAANILRCAAAQNDSTPTLPC